MAESIYTFPEMNCKDNTKLLRKVICKMCLNALKIAQCHLVQRLIVQTTFSQMERVNPCGNFHFYFHHYFVNVL